MFKSFFQKRPPAAGPAAAPATGANTQVADTESASTEGQAMLPRAPEADDGRLQPVIAAIRSLAPPQAAALERFAALLFAELDDESLSMHAPERLARLAAAAFDHFRLRRPGEAAVAAEPLADEGGSTPATMIVLLNDDMPFLLDSALAELRELGVATQLTVHPIIPARRNAGGGLEAFGDEAGTGAARESFILMLARPLGGAAEAGTLRDRLRHVLGQARLAHQDAAEMRRRLDALVAAIAAAPVPEAGEAGDFLRWAASGHFVLLGMRDYALAAMNGDAELRPRVETGLGLLRDPSMTVLRRGGAAVRLSAESREFFLSPDPLVFSIANARSDVYRRAHFDTIGVKAYGADGAITGETRLIGLYTPGALSRSALAIPLIRRKAQRVLARAGLDDASHSGRSLSYVLETFPRVELLQIPEEQLLAFSKAIMQLNVSPRTRLLLREDQFGRFVSALVYVLRERYTTAVRERICDALAKAFGGRVAAFTPFFPDGPMVRLYILIWRDEGELPRPDAAALEKRIDAATRSWRDDLDAQLIRHYGYSAAPFALKYGSAFPAGYQETNPPARALEDIARLEALTDENPAAIEIFADAPGPSLRLRAMLHQLDEPIALSRRVPILENLGFNVVSERTFELAPMMAGARRKIFLHDSVIEAASGEPINVAEHEKRLEEGFVAVWRGLAENDRFNGLILNAGLDWREAALMRAYAAYLRQTAAPFGLAYLAQTLNRHGGVVCDLVTLFRRLFDPARGEGREERAAGAAQIAARIEEKLKSIPSLDEDRVLRHFLNLIQATLRTNFYQRNAGGGLPETIAFKLRSEMVEALPAPRPYAEIFVASPRFEGVHLRGGPIARGGLRWSDRPQDFRTEILGLAKAQQVKNAVIVPQGAKGGFVPKKLPEGDREAALAEGVACYRGFINALLSITDNLIDSRVAEPAGVIRLDADDPYLVVAADKGTATFSDIANGIAAERGFWLGDAFASGGSAGYDHKKMGITARGAWECVKRHFREMNIDIQSQPIRVAGVGDMSGDVFGNGMLLSKALKVVAAFDHRDIFIDPDPDPAASWAERQRLFDLPRSSWRDYDPALLSKGGGVYSRSAKSVALSPEAQAMLGLGDSATPAQIMNAILRAGVDLVWFGGIGCYVRASAESNEQAGDRANDAIRVTAAELGAKVAGEGANLAMTQRARVEFAMRGGRCNTDAIDNSAGVNSSDYEVNIKIALGEAVKAGSLPVEERNAFMASMTDQVAAGCLRNNYLQSLALSLGEARRADDLDFQRRLIQKFEAAGRLDRKLEALPSDQELRERQMQRIGLTRPELAVLLAYAKIDLKTEILASAVPDDAYLGQALAAYFPEAMRGRFAAEIAAHPLRREIIATVLANAIINRGGSTFAVRLTDETGHEPESIAYAFAAAEGVFGLSELYDAIDALDGRIDGRRQLDLYILAQDHLRRTTGWFLRHGDFRAGLTREIERYRASLMRVEAALDAILPDALVQTVATAARDIAAFGAPAPLAFRLARLPILAQGLDIALAARAAEAREEAVGRAHFEAGAHFRLEDLRMAAGMLAHGDHFDRLAVSGALEAAAAAQRAIARQAAAPEAEDAAGFEAWRSRNADKAARIRRSLDEILGSGELTLAKLTVAASHLRGFA